MIVTPPFQKQFDAFLTYQEQLLVMEYDYMYYIE